MKVKKSIEVEIDFDIPFSEACKVVLTQMDSTTCDEFEMIVDRILLDFDLKSEGSVPIVDLMKDEVLAKIKEEFSLEKIEQLYENNRKSS